MNISLVCKDFQRNKYAAIPGKLKPVIEAHDYRGTWLGTFLDEGGGVWTFLEKGSEVWYDHDTGLTVSGKFISKSNADLDGLPDEMALRL